MRILKPSAVYVNESVLQIQQARSRLDRMMSRTNTPEVREERKDDLYQALDHVYSGDVFDTNNGL